MRLKSTEPANPPAGTGVLPPAKTPRIELASPKSVCPGVVKSPNFVEFPVEEIVTNLISVVGGDTLPPAKNPLVEDEQEANHWTGIF